MAAANSLARFEHEAGFPGEIFHEGSANNMNLRTPETTGSHTFSKQKRVRPQYSYKFVGHAENATFT